MEPSFIKMLTTSILLFACLMVSAQGESDGYADNDTSVQKLMVENRLFPTEMLTNTASISTIPGSTLDKMTSPSLSGTLSGQLPGLFVRHGDSKPSSNGSWSMIRGVGSYGRGTYNNERVYLNGFKVPRSLLSTISLAEIESVSILKDAASLATFGMEGANGIIWIQTKRGNIGKASTRVRLRSGIQKPINIQKPLNSYDYASLYNQAISNDNGQWTPTYSDAQLESYKNGTGTDVDWYDETIKNAAPYKDIDLIFNGGSEKGRYNIVLGYGNQEGLYNVQNTDETSNLISESFNLSSNLDFSLFNDVIEASVDINGRLQSVKRPDYTSLESDLSRYPSNIYPVYDELVTEDELNFSGTSLFPNNPVGSLNGVGWRVYNNRVIQSNFRLKENLDFIVEGLYMQQRFSFYTSSISGYGKTRSYARYYEGVSTTTHQTTSITAIPYHPVEMDQRMQGDVALGYDNTFGKSLIHSALNFRVSNRLGEGLINYQENDMNLSGRVHYSYNSRYVGELGFSYYGSDAFAPGNRWGFYPAVSGAWIISNESFMKDQNSINVLKLRGSVGLSGEVLTNASYSGYASNGRYLYQQYYAHSTPFYKGISAPFSNTSSLSASFIANANAFAEQSLKYNLGVDVRLFDKWQLMADVFIDKRSGILTNQSSAMLYYGNYDILLNIGEMTNKGIELSSIFENKVGNLNYSINGMVFYAHNVIDYQSEIPKSYPYNETTGRSYGTHMGLEAIAFYQLSDFNPDGSLKEDLPIPTFGTVQPGDLRYNDLNGDGFIDETDITKIGSPDYSSLEYSFGAQLEFKGFDFNFLFHGAAGGSVNLLNYGEFVPFVNNGNAYEIAKNAWAYYPNQGIDTRATATFPRLTTESNPNNFRASDFWIRKNDYLRLKNIVIGYDFSNVIFRSNDKISELRIFLNGVNLLTFSNILDKYNMDPESRYGYPNLKSYYMGISLAF